MANRYVYTGGSNTSPYDTWAKAATSMTAALTGSAAGDIFYIAHDHTDNMTATTTLTSPGTNAAPCQFLCVNRAGSVPPVSADLRTTAVIQTTGTFSLTLAGIWHAYGLTFIAGIGSAAAANIVVGGAGTTFVLKNCKFRIATTFTSSRLTLSASSSRNIWDNVTVEFGATAQGIQAAGMMHWRNTASAVVGATIPTPFFNISASTGQLVLIEGIDLSAVGSGKTLVGTPTNATGSVILKDCKLNAAVTIAVQPGSPGTTAVDILNCDSGATNTRNERWRFEGTETTELTIVRSGGATNGTTPVARKIITTANAKWSLPFECMPFSIWNETTGSAINLTMEGVWGPGSLPNNDQVWFDVEYPSDASSPLGTYSSGTKTDVLATGTALTSSSETWGGSTTKFKQTRTITPQAKGWIYVYPKVGIASTTVYLDPEITVS